MELVTLGPVAMDSEGSFDKLLASAVTRLHYSQSVWQRVFISGHSLGHLPCLRNHPRCYDARSSLLTATCLPMLGVIPVAVVFNVNSATARWLVFLLVVCL